MVATIRVLYVDDESALLELGKMFLERSGDFTVTTATSAPDALRLLEQETFDTIVSDYQMPEMNGIEFLDFVRTKFGQIPFILFTGKGREEVVIQAINSGADFYLQKGGESGAQFAELSHKIKSAASRKLADGALKRSEENYRHLIEHSYEAIGVAQDGVLKLVNHRVVELTGYSEQELLSMSFLVFIHPDDRAMVMERYQKRMKREEFPSRYAFRLIPKDGSIRWVEINVAAIDWDGRPATLNFLTDITERKRAEDALRESEERFKYISELIPDFAYSCTKAPNGGFAIDWITGAPEQITGYTTDEIKEMTCWKFLVIDEDIPVFEKNVTGLSPGESVRCELRIRRKDGCIMWLSSYAQCVTDQKEPGNHRLYGACRNITERKRAERILQDIIDKNPMSIQIVDKDGFTLTVNSAHTRLFGSVPPSDFSIFNDSQLKKQGFGELIERIKNGEAVTFPDTYYNAHDSFPEYPDVPVWVRAVVFPLMDNYGKLERFVFMHENITSRKRAEEDLRESKALVDAVVENVPLMIFLKEAKDLRFVLFNRAGEELLGYDRKALLGKNDLDFFPPEQAAHFMTKDRDVLDGDLNLLDIPEESILTAKKGLRLLHTRKVCIRGADGTTKFLLGISEDITERRQAEETIRHALAEKEVLLREIHHRVKNNLAGILALIELQISSLSDPAAISLLKDMETRIRSMALVHESLYLTEDLARINVATYTETLTRHLFQVYETATEVRCTIDMGDVTMSIETAMPCGLVMNEIVTNSLKYAFPDTFSCGEIRGEPCTITLTLHREGSDYLLKIADNGIGIPEGIDVSMSHSLGLFLIRFIVEHQLRGSLMISTAGGTTYTIRFPEPVVKERQTDEKM